MPRLYEILPPAQQFALAVRANEPHILAETFAAYVGQFYDRSDFDRLARQVGELYDAEDSGRADRFRSRLDRRLHDRYREPVPWDATPHNRREAA
jgi:hypothetical protein